MAEPVVPSTFVPNETLIHQNIQSDPAVKAQQIVDSAPHLAKEPQTVMALASHPTADGHTLASVAQLAQHVSAATSTIEQHSESNPKQSSAPHWWDSLSNAINDVSDKIVGGAQRGLNFVSDVTSLPRVPLNAVGDTLSNFVGDIPHLADQALTLMDTNRMTEQAIEGQNVSQIQKNYVQATNLINPLAMYHNGRSTMAMYEMLKQTKGTAYANTWLSTNVALAVVTKKALGVGSAEGVSGEVSAEAAAAEKAAIKNDPKLVKDFEKRTANGETLTQEEKDAASQAQQRIDQRKVLADQEKRMKADRQEKLRQQTKLRRGTAAVTKAVTLPIKPAFAALKFASKPGQDVTLNLMYQYAQMSSQGNPDMAKMWEQAQTGIVTDKYGRKVTAGQELAELFGATPGDMAFQMGGGAIDFYNKWLGTDALGATGKVIAESRTAEGFGSGLLSKWFNGLGMTNGDRVYQALQQYPRVARAFEYMATHDRVDILRTFRGTFDYASPAGKAALEALGNAKSVEEVARIFADLAEGTGLVRNTVPTMTNYELLKATLPTTKLFSGDASKLLSMDEYVIEEYQKATAGKTGWDFMPKNAAEAGSSDVGLRSRATFGRWLVKQFTRNAAFIDEITKKWSNSVIRPGSTTGLEAMADHLRAARLPERVIKAAINSLIDAPPEDYVRLYRSVYFHAVARRFMVGASNAAADSLLVNGLSHIRDEVMRMTGSDGGSILGSYLGGLLGDDLSQIVEVGDSAFAGSTYFAGIGFTHLGELTLPNVSSLRGLSVQTNRIILNLTKPEANRLAKMLHLDLKTLENLSTFAKASLKGMEGTVSKLSGSRPDTSFTGDYSKTSAMGYEQVINAYSKIIREASAETTIQENQQFVKTFDTLRKQLFQLREYISQHSEYKVAEGIVGDWNTPIGKQIIKELNARLPEGGIQDIRSLTPITIARLEGQEAALNDIASKFLERLRTPDFSFKEIRDHIAQYEETMGKAAVADKALAEELASKFERLQEKNSAFLNPWQKLVVGLNMLLSKTFVPMALGSGGWALRVSLSETILNTLRQGWGKSFESRVLTSIAKHESVSAADVRKFGNLDLTPKSMTNQAVMENKGMIPWNEQIRDILKGNEKDYVTTPEKAHSELLRKNEELTRRISEESERRARPDYMRKFGADEGIVNRLRSDISRRGETNSLTYEQVREAEKFIDQIGRGLFDNVRIGTISRSMATDEFRSNVKGNYEAFSGIVNLFAGAIHDDAGINRTLLHELWHHLSSLSTEEQVAGFGRELKAARTKVLKDKPLDEWLAKNIVTEDDRKLAKKYPIMGNHVRTYDYVANLVKDGAHRNPEKINWSALPTEYSNGENYRLTNIDEWFAESMYDRTATRLEHRNVFIEAGHRFISSIYAAINRLFGYKVGEKMFRDFWAGRYSDKAIDPMMAYARSNGIEIRNMIGKDQVSKITNRSGQYVAGEWMTRKDETSLIVKTIAHALLGVREIAAGTALGIERNLVNLNDIGSQRMLDNFASAIIRHNGHLPLGVHDQGGDIYDDGLAHASKVYGIDEKGNPATDMVYRDRTFVHVNAGGKGYVTALFESLGRIHADPVLLPTMQTLSRILDEKAVNELGAKAASVMTSEQRLKVGARYFTTEAEINQLTEQLELQAYDTIQRMNPEERARFARDHSTNKKGFSYSGTGTFPESEVPHRDWAKAIAYHDLHMVMGRPVGEDYMIHASLLDQAATGELKAPAELAKDIKAIPRGAEPKNVPARQFIDRNWRKDGSAVNFLQNISEKLHSGVLGPIVNTLSRDPVFLLEYHNAYEALRPMLENNLITIEQAEVKADTAAIQNMSKYVHNPKDKTVFEANMRVAAPFYFAQNQAWRRALRVLRDDPGAFEKYLKLCLNITNHVSTSVANGMASMHIPGSQFMGAIGEFTNPLDSPFANLMFGLSADPGSVSSIAPTGAEGGWGMLGILRASWGPVVTIPVKLADKYFNLHNIPLANKIVETFLGPISSRTGIMSDAVPSPAIRNTVGLILHHNDTMASVTLEVMHNAADNLLTKYYNQTYNQIKDAPNMTHDQKVTLARSYAETEATKWMNNSANKQAFLDQAQTSATWMFVVKTVLSFGSPFALSLQAQFSKYPQFQQILTETNPLTKQKNTFEQAATIFIEKYPTALFDLTSVSNSPYVPYAETKSAVDLLTNHPEVANKYPYAAAYVIDRNAKYDSSAYSLELSMGLRSRQSPENYYESLMNAAGQDFYYNYLKPQYDTNAPGQQGYKNYVELSNAAQNYGRFVNPIWYGNFKSGKGKYIAEANAFSEMETMLADPTVPDSLFGGKDERDTYNALIKKYQDTVIAYDNASSARERASIQNTWYDNITALSTAKSDDGELLFARQAYFMTSVLRNLPTKTQ